MKPCRGATHIVAWETQHSVQAPMQCGESLQHKESLEQKGACGMREMGLEMYMEILQKAMKYLQRKRELGLGDSEEDGELLAAAVEDSDLVGLMDSLSL